MAAICPRPPRVLIRQLTNIGNDWGYTWECYIRKGYKTAEREYFFKIFFALDISPEFRQTMAKRQYNHLMKTRRLINSATRRYVNSRRLAYSRARDEVARNMNHVPLELVNIVINYMP